jgi:hypothetical protein
MAHSPVFAGILAMATRVDMRRLAHTTPGMIRAWFAGLDNPRATNDREGARMPTVIIELKHCGWTAIALLVIPLVCLSLGACGSSSSGTSSSSSTPTSAQATSTSTTAPNTTPTTTTPTRTTPTSTTVNDQLKPLYDCLVRGGIKLPPFDQLGKAKINTTTPHYQAVLKKCEQELHS